MAFDLECKDVAKRYGDFSAVASVSLQVPQGSFFSILGPSGCGKTTLLRMIAGFVNPTSGDILIDGRSILGTPPNRRPVNMVFQHLALFPMMNVAENIGYGLRRRGLPREEIARKVDAVLARIGLPDAAAQTHRSTLRRPETARRHRPLHGPRADRACCSTSRLVHSTSSCASR